MLLINRIKVFIPFPFYINLSFIRWGVIPSLKLYNTFVQSQCYDVYVFIQFPARTRRVAVGYLPTFGVSIWNEVVMYTLRHVLYCLSFILPQGLEQWIINRDLSMPYSYCKYILTTISHRLDWVRWVNLRHLGSMLELMDCTIFYKGLGPLLLLLLFEDNEIKRNVFF